MVSEASEAQDEILNDAEQAQLDNKINARIAATKNFLQHKSKSMDVGGPSQSTLSKILSQPDLEDGEEGKDDVVSALDKLERMTDPYRRQSVNTSEELLPLPERGRKKLRAHRM